MPAFGTDAHVGSAVSRPTATRRIRMEGGADAEGQPRTWRSGSHLSVQQGALRGLCDGLRGRGAPGSCSTTVAGASVVRRMGPSCGQSRVRARVRPHAALPVRRGVSRGRSIGDAGAAHPVVLSRPPHLQATHRSTRLSRAVCVRCGHPLLFHEDVDPYTTRLTFQKKVRYLCGLFGHRVDTVATRDGFVEYACHCGHSFLRAESACQTIRHPLVCVLFGHRIGYLARRGGFAEYVCRDCGHPFCFAEPRT